MRFEVLGWVTVSPEGPKGSSVSGQALLNNDVTHRPKSCPQAGNGWPGSKRKL